MPVVHCSGHAFDEVYSDNSSVPTLWVCEECGLKVRTPEAAAYFNGMQS